MIDYDNELKRLLTNIDQILMDIEFFNAKLREQKRDLQEQITETIKNTCDEKGI